MKNPFLRVVLGLIILFVVLQTIGASSEAEQNLSINQHIIEQLKALRGADKFTDLPGYDTKEEKQRLQNHLDNMLDKIIVGIEKNPKKSWLVSEMKPTIQEIYLEDTEARDRFVAYTQQVFGIVGATISGSEFSEYMFSLK